LYASLRILSRKFRRASRNESHRVARDESRAVFVVRCVRRTRVACVVARALPVSSREKNSREKIARTRVVRATSRAQREV
jgi:hypothetical protein